MSYQRIDVAQNPGLGMLGRHNITINGNPPALIHAHLRITCHSVHHRSQLWAEKKNVYAGIGGYVIELGSDGFLQYASVEIAHKSTVNIDCSASLVFVSQQCPTQTVLELGKYSVPKQ